MAKIDRILLVGAGPAGLALAIALRRQGRAPELIERAPTWSTAGTGLYLVGNGTRALRSLGVADAAMRAGHVIRSQAFCDHQGAILAMVDVAAYWARCGPCLALRRAELLRLLAEQLGDLPVRWNTSVAALHEVDGHVAVRFDDGSEGNFDLVVGADGIRSSIRRLLFSASPPRYRGQLAWRFIARRPPGIDGWTVFLGKGTSFLLVPVDAAHAYCYADIRSEHPAADGATATPERLRAVFRAYASPVQQVLDSLPDGEATPSLPIEDVVPQRWGIGNVVLIGDAAHAMSPNMASGAALALEDALVLAELLDQDVPPTLLVAHLAQRRGQRVAWVALQTERRDRTRALPPAVRNLSLHLIGAHMYRQQYHPLLAPP